MFRKFNVAALSLLALLLVNCGSAVDTSKYNVEEYYNYLMSLYNEEDYESAVPEFQNFLLQYSGSAYNDDAQYYLAMTYFKREQYLLSAYEFSKLIRNIPASPFVSESQYMLAECYYQLAPPYQLEQSYTKKAIEEFQAFIDFFPADKKAETASAKIKELNERLAEKEYQAAVIYEKMEYERAAIKYYSNVAEYYHDTQFAPQALYRKIQLEIKKGMNSEALSDAVVFLSRYPYDVNAKEIQEIETRLSQNK
ncbi:MAG: outer membrane protein assembly factor BamD [Bacteroidota bacterium]